MRTTRIVRGALLAIGLAAAGLGVGAGDALALPSQPHQWCPGMPMHNPPGPGNSYVWDMNVCHTWQYVKPGMGNLASKTGVPPLDPITSAYTKWEITAEGSGVWEGPDMPPEAVRECGNDGFLGFPVSC